MRSTIFPLLAPLAPIGRAAWRFTVCGLVAAAVCAVPRGASAISGFYGQLGVGYGKLSGSGLVVTKIPGSDDLPQTGEGCCSTAGPTSQLRLGYSFFGFGGAEFGIIGHGWDLGKNSGGAGFVGGGLRAFPLQLLTLAGMDMADFPIDVGIGALYGVSLIGKDFAYTGTFFDVDFHVDYKVLEWMSIGVKVDVVMPKLNDFVFTDYSAKLGRCLDSAGEQVAGPNNDPVGPMNSDRIKKDNASCSGKGPTTTLISPQIVLTFHFDPFE